MGEADKRYFVSSVRADRESGLTLVKAIQEEVDMFANDGPFHLHTAILVGGEVILIFERKDQ